MNQTPSTEKSIKEQEDKLLVIGMLIENAKKGLAVINSHQSQNLYSVNSNYYYDLKERQTREVHALEQRKLTETTALAVLKSNLPKPVPPLLQVIRRPHNRPSNQVVRTEVVFRDRY